MANWWQTGGKLVANCWQTAGKLLAFGKTKQTVNYSAPTDYYTDFKNEFKNSMQCKKHVPRELEDPLMAWRQKSVQPLYSLVCSFGQWASLQTTAVTTCLAKLPYPILR